MTIGDFDEIGSNIKSQNQQLYEDLIDHIIGQTSNGKISWYYNPFSSAFLYKDGSLDLFLCKRALMRDKESKSFLFFKKNGQTESWEELSLYINDIKIVHNYKTRETLIGSEKFNFEQKLDLLWKVVSEKKEEKHINYIKSKIEQIKKL